MLQAENPPRWSHTPFLPYSEPTSIGSTLNNIIPTCRDLEARGGHWVNVDIHYVGVESIVVGLSGRDGGEWACVRGGLPVCMRSSGFIPEAQLSVWVWVVVSSVSRVSSSR